MKKNKEQEFVLSKENELWPAMRASFIETTKQRIHDLTEQYTFAVTCGNNNEAKWCNDELVFEKQQLNKAERWMSID